MPRARHTLKNILLLIAFIVVVILSIIPPFAKADWTRSDDGYFYNHKSSCDRYVEDVIIILHGATIHDSSRRLWEDVSLAPFIDKWLDTCSVIVIPTSGEVIYKGKRAYIWDYTGEFTLGKEENNLVQLISLANNLFHKPVHLIGGSAGGIMAYKTLINLDRMGKSGLLASVTLLDSISPFMFSSTGNKPFLLTGLDTQVLFRDQGASVHVPRDKKYDYIALGMPSPSHTIDTKVLFIYSREDEIIPDRLKEYFAKGLSRYFPNLFIAIVGKHHKVGIEGLTLVSSGIGK